AVAFAVASAVAVAVAVALAIAFAHAPPDTRRPALPPGVVDQRTHHLPHLRDKRRVYRHHVAQRLGDLDGRHHLPHRPGPCMIASRPVATATRRPLGDIQRHT